MFTFIDRKKERERSSQTCKFRLPDVHSYAKQKGIAIAQNSSQAEIGDSQLNTEAVFSQRVNAAMHAKRFAQAVYPGALIPSPGHRANFLYRGNLFRDQYEFFQLFGWFPDSGGSVHLVDVPKEQSWLWPEIEQPDLKFVLPKAASLESRIENQSLIEMGDRLLESSFSPTESMLQLVHHLWEQRPAFYSTGAISQSKTWLASLGHRSFASALPALFEIEAGASFLTYTEDLPILTQLRLEDNWISVFKKPLSSIRQSELCLTSRIHDELFNLRSGRFAPIIINEYDTVADGNHRFTTSWIWNVLRHCLGVEWRLDSCEFRFEIRRALVRTGLFNTPVTLHQVLFHLGKLLSDDQTARRLESALKPTLHRGDFVEHVPVVFVPEYLSCAASKVEYDNGDAVVRAHPALYRALSEAPHTVLPPRSSYHYTDCILLPWFDIGA